MLVAEVPCAYAANQEPAKPRPRWPPALRSRTPLRGVHLPERSRTSVAFRQETPPDASSSVARPGLEARDQRKSTSILVSALARPLPYCCRQPGCPLDRLYCSRRTCCADEVCEDRSPGSEYSCPPAQASQPSWRR